MATPVQSHGVANWRESANSGATPPLGLGILVNAPVEMALEWNYGDPLPAGLVFTGDQNRTYYDVNGVVRYAPYNYAWWSEDFTSGVWNKVTATITPGVSDPNGGTSASTFTATGAAADVYQQVSATAGTDTAAIWIRRRTGTGAVKLIDPVGARITVAITGTWARYSATAVGGALPFIGVELATSGDAVDIFGAHFQPGPNVEAYVKTLGAAAGGPRNTGYVRNSSGQLVGAWLAEGQRTNLAKWSADLSNAVYAKTLVTGTAAVGTGPDGGTTASRVTWTTGTGGEIFQDDGEGSSVASRTFTFSVWLKSDTLSAARITLGLNGGTERTSSDKVLTSSWQRFSITKTFSGAPANNTVQPLIQQAASAAGSILAWGWQLEEAAFLSSYIPTTSAAVTRAAETDSIAATDSPGPVSFYGKLVVEAVAPTTGAYGIFQRGGSGNSGVKAQAYFDTADNRVTFGFSDGVTFLSARDTQTFAPGDVLEFVASILSSGKVSILTAKNGGAATTATLSAASATFPAAYGGALLCFAGLGSTVSGFAAFQSFRTALDGPWSLAQMQKTALDPNRFMFAPSGTPVGSLVSDGHGGYVVTPGNFTGTGKAVFVTGGNTVVY